MDLKQASLRVVIASPGLGWVNRGYETFADGLAGALATCPGVEVRVLQGGRVHRKSSGRIRVPFFRSDRRAASMVSRLTGVTPLTVERLTFAVCSIPILFVMRADVVITSERQVCSVFHRSRRIMSRRLTVVLNNGGNHRPPFRRVDLVKHSSPTARQWALDAGEPSDRHIVLEEGVKASALVVSKSEARRNLGLPLDRFIVLSVGLLDLDHTKRMGYIVQEVANSGIYCHLVLIGQRDEQTPLLERLASELMPNRVSIATVSPEDVAEFHFAADILVSASCREGFGRSIVEAMVHGLPVLVHDDEVMRWVVADEGRFFDANQQGALAESLRSAIAGDGVVLPRNASTRFSWSVLAPKYVEALQDARTLAER
jgi:1,2-diacylglycerol 3-alpha-glucosyltransferase